jgi:hypothetical protein
MSHLLWTPGMAGPLDEFVKRVLRMVEQFAGEHELEQTEVRLELADGSTYQLASVSSEPGFGFLSFVPHRAEGDEPRFVVVPVGAVKVIEVSAPDTQRPFGFAVA